MIACSEAVRRLWEYLDQSLDGPHTAEVEEHLAACRRCCGEMEFAQELRSMLARQASDEMPPDVRSRLTGLLRTMEQGGTTREP